MGERIGAYRVLVGKPVGRRPSGKHRRMWEDAIKIDLQTIRWGVNYTDVAQYRHRWRAVVKSAVKLWSPENAEDSLTRWENVSF
jgi:hypothetical protein